MTIEQAVCWRNVQMPVDEASLKTCGLAPEC
jgi:hypothetical protein